MKTFKTWLYCLITVCLAASCRPGKPATDNVNEQKTVTVSIEPLRYLTEQIAGPTIKVNTLVPKGSSPETYEPTPSQMEQLGKSMIFFSIGDLGFERTWLNRLQQAAPQTAFIRTSEGILPLDNQHHAEDGHQADPHVWTSPENMKIIARNICMALCQADTANSTLFRTGLQQTLTDIEQIADSIRHLTDSLHQRAFLIYHPALTYFAREYRLEQVAIETDGKEPSPAQLARLIDECRKRQIRIILVQQEFDRKNAEMIAKEIHATIHTINPLAYDWDAEMLNIAQTLHRQ